MFESGKDKKSAQTYINQMIRTYLYALYPNKHQESILYSWLGLCCNLYNAALEQRITAWRHHRKSINYNHQTKDLTDLRASDTAFAFMPAIMGRSALKRLDHAFKAFFRRVLQGETPGFPRFKSKDRYKSFSIGKVSVSGNKVRVPNLGKVSFKRHRPFEGEIRNITIKRSASRWWVAIACEVGDPPAKTETIQQDAGFDLGLTTFATLVTGSEPVTSQAEKIKNPRYFKRGQDTLARRQQALQRKVKGSRSRFKAKRLVGKAHEHVHHQRLDHARKLASDLVGRYDAIFFEDMDIENLIKDNEHTKSILDASWMVFIQALVFKAEWAGKWAVGVDPRGTTQRCSRCQTWVAKGLNDRWHSCFNCGLELDRDHNAGFNILMLGRSMLPALAGAEPC